MAKVVACEEAEKKLERAIRKGEVKCFYNNDWIKEAETKGVLNADEIRNLAELRDMTARVIAVDDFAASELAREHMKPGDASSCHERQDIAAE